MHHHLYNLHDDGDPLSETAYNFLYVRLHVQSKCALSCLVCKKSGRAKIRPAQQLATAMCCELRESHL